jgi:butyryl-CoA dehydrogenase
MASGKKLGCFALTEANAGSDVANMSTIATPDKDGEWYSISGSKLFISNAAEAEYCILFAYTDKSRGHRGISAFVVNLKTPGIKVGKPERKLGIHGCSTCEIEFGEGAVVPKGNLLGEEGLGFKIALGTLNGGRISIAAQALGLAQGALDIAVQFSKDRVQFGKPISSFQAVSFSLARMATELAAARWLTWHAAWLKDQGEKYILESAMAKAKAGEVSNFVCNKAVQILGGYGYTEDYKVERMLRDARITEIYEGTTEMQWMTVAKMLLA